MACVCASMETIVLTPRVSFGVNFRSCRGKRSISKGGPMSTYCLTLHHKGNFSNKHARQPHSDYWCVSQRKNIYESSSPVSAHTLRETKFLRKYGHDVVIPTFRRVRSTPFEPKSPPLITPKH
jgi:hypothetical protein